MHDLGERHELLLGVGPGGEVGDRALLHPRGHVGEPRRDRAEGGAVVLAVVEARDVHALDLGEVAEEPLAAALGAPGPLPRRHHLGDLGDHLLAVAEDGDVDEVGQRLGVERAVAADHHEGVGGGAASRVQRDAGEVDALEDVRVDELGRQVEGQDVERRLAGRWVSTLKSGTRCWRSSAAEVGPRAVGPLGHGVVALVEQLVEDLQALVGQADLVGVGVGEQPRHLVGGVVRRDHAVFHADVAGRLLHPRQEHLELGPDRPAGWSEPASDGGDVLVMGVARLPVHQAVVVGERRRRGTG